MDRAQRGGRVRLPGLPVATQEGPYRRVNPDIIRARHVTPTATSSYRFVDVKVESGRTYYYYLDTVSDGGFKQRLSGVITKEVAGEIVR